MVFQDRAAHAAAELVAFDLILSGGEKVARVHIAIAQKLEYIAMNLIGAGLAHDIDHAAHRVAILGAHVRPLDAELLDGVRIGERQVRVHIGVVVGYAVHLVVDAFRKCSVGLGILFARIGAALAIGAAIVRCGIGNTGREKDQRLDLASIERQIDNLPLVDHLADGGGLRRDQRGVAGYGHLLRDSTDTHHNLLGGGLADGQLESGLHVSGHPLLLDR